MDNEEVIRKNGLIPTKIIRAKNGKHFIVFGTKKSAIYKEKDQPVVMPWEGAVDVLQQSNPHACTYTLESAYLEKDLKQFIKKEFAEIL